jgi:hypothetical protein
MAARFERPITAAALRSTAEWRTVYPGADLLWEEVADEGAGHGFDGLDPSAMTRAYFQADAGWDEILGWYQERLTSLGWDGEEKGHEWWEWRAGSRRAEHLWIIRRRAGYGMWMPLGARPNSATVFEFGYSVATTPDPRADADA